MKRQKLPLVLEQLEDRIFLDANPLVVVDGAHDHVEDPTVEVPVEVIAEPVVEPVAAEPENTEQHVENPDGDSAGSEEHAGNVDDVQNQNSEESGQNDPAVEQDGEIASEDANDAGTQNTEIVLRFMVMWKPISPKTLCWMERSDTKTTATLGLHSTASWPVV